MKSFFFTILACCFGILGIVTPSALAQEACGAVSNFTFTADPPTEPYSTATLFTFIGQVDCTKSQEASAGLFLYAEAPGEFDTLAVPFDLTDDQGNFTQLVRGSSLSVGTWTFRVDRTQPGATLAGPNSIPITIGQEANEEEETIPCGSEAPSPDDDARCQQGCPRKFNAGANKWFCTQEGSESATCRSTEDYLAITTGCLANGIFEEPVACGTTNPGVFCSTGYICHTEGNGEKALQCLVGIQPTPTPPRQPCQNDAGEVVSCPTAIGNLLINPIDFVSMLMGILLSISSMVAVYLIIRSGYQIMMSRGNPEAIQEAKERLVAAIVGLLFVIFSLIVFQIIGIDILRLPGFVDNDAQTDAQTCTDGFVFDDTLGICVQSGTSQPAQPSPTPFQDSFIPGSPVNPSQDEPSVAPRYFCEAPQSCAPEGPFDDPATIYFSTQAECETNCF